MRQSRFDRFSFKPGRSEDSTTTLDILSTNGE
jgi:hypothetical protein